MGKRKRKLKVDADKFLASPTQYGYQLKVTTEKILTTDAFELDLSPDYHKAWMALSNEEKMNWDLGCDGAAEQGYRGGLAEYFETYYDPEIDLNND